jgi:hypothetical protein
VKKEREKESPKHKKLVIITVKTPFSRSQAVMKKNCVAAAQLDLAFSH